MFLLRGGLCFQQPLQGGGIQQVHGLEFPLVEHRPVVEHTGEAFGLFQRRHRAEGQGYAPPFTAAGRQFHALEDVGALHVIVDGQFLARDGVGLGAGGKAGDGAVKGQGQQFIAVRCGVRGLKAKRPGEGLVGEPGLLLFRPQHTDAGPALGAGIRQAVLHQGPPVSPAPVLPPQDPEAVDIEVVVPQDRHPGGLQGRVFDEHGGLCVQFAKDVPLPEPLAEPLPLGLHAPVGLFAADDAAQMFLSQIFLRQIDKYGVLHRRPPSAIRLGPLYHGRGPAASAPRDRKFPVDCAGEVWYNQHDKYITLI